MHEILFRGKRTYNGKWVEGFYHCAVDGHILKNHCYITTFMKLDSGEIITLGQFDVTPDTVGQYTGLTDKNGVKIFEGDIVRSVSGGYSNFIILWDNQNALWFLRAKNYTTDFYHHFSNEFEVIGNVYDNPELLERIGY